MEALQKHTPERLHVELLNSLAAIYQQSSSSTATTTPTAELLLRPQCLQAASGSVVMFLDISGFTYLSTRMTAERLHQIINAYFTKLIVIIRRYRGQIIKFAGDALYCTFEAAALDDAVACAAEILQHCSEHEITFISDIRDSRSRRSISDVSSPCVATESRKSFVGGRGGGGGGDGVSSESEKALLNLRLCISTEGFWTMQCGGSGRYEYLLVGKAIRELAMLDHESKVGELLIGASCFEELRESTTTSSPLLLYTCLPVQKLCDYDEDVLDFDEEEAPVIGYRLHPKTGASSSSPITGGIGASPEEEGGGEEEEQQHAIEELARRAFSSVVGSHPEEDFASFNAWMLPLLLQRLHEHVHQSISPSLSSTLTKGGDHTSELRSIVVLFFSFTFEDGDALFVNDAGMEEHCLPLLQLCSSTLNAILVEYGGHLRQFIVDDKGCVGIASFGTKHSVRYNNVQTAIDCAHAVIESLLVHDVVVRVGITLGVAFCGIIGHPLRHEFSLLGRSVNLAARLMASSPPYSAICDESIRVNDSVHIFTPNGDIRAKGFTERVSTYKTLCTTAAGSSSLLPKGGMSSLKTSSLNLGMSSINLQYLSPLKPLKVADKAKDNEHTVEAYEAENFIIGNDLEVALSLSFFFGDLEHEESAFSRLEPREALDAVLKMYQHKFDASKLDSSKLKVWEGDSGSGCTTIIRKLARLLSPRLDFVMCKASFAHSSTPLHAWRSLLMQLAPLICSRLLKGEEKERRDQEGVGEKEEEGGVASLLSRFLDTKLAGTSQEARTLLLQDLCRDRLAASSELKIASAAFLQEYYNAAAQCVQAYVDMSQAALVIAIDDVHHCDFASLQLVSRLFTQNTGILFVLTQKCLSSSSSFSSSKLPSLAQGSNSRATFTALAEAPETSSRICFGKVRSLGPEQVRHMVTSLIKNTSVHDLLKTEDVLASTGGNPGFILDLIRSANDLLKKSKNVSSDDLRNTVTEEACAFATTPKSVETSGSSTSRSSVEALLIDTLHDGKFENMIFFRFDTLHDSLQFLVKLACVCTADELSFSIMVLIDVLSSSPGRLKELTTYLQSRYPSVDFSKVPSSRIVAIALEDTGYFVLDDANDDGKSTSAKSQSMEIREEIFSSLENGDWSEAAEQAATPLLLEISDAYTTHNTRFTSALVKKKIFNVIPEETKIAIHNMCCEVLLRPVRLLVQIKERNSTRAAITNFSVAFCAKLAKRSLLAKRTLLAAALFFACGMAMQAISTDESMRFFFLASNIVSSRQLELPGDKPEDFENETIATAVEDFEEITQVISDFTSVSASSLSSPISATQEGDGVSQESKELYEHFLGDTFAVEMVITMFVRMSQACITSHVSPKTSIKYWSMALHLIIHARTTCFATAKGEAKNLYVDKEVIPRYIFSALTSLTVLCTPSSSSTSSLTSSRITSRSASMDSLSSFETSAVSAATPATPASSAVTASTSPSPFALFGIRNSASIFPVISGMIINLHIYRDKLQDSSDEKTSSRLQLARLLLKLAVTEHADVVHHVRGLAILALLQSQVLSDFEATMNTTRDIRALHNSEEVSTETIKLYGNDMGLQRLAFFPQYLLLSGQLAAAREQIEDVKYALSSGAVKHLHTFMFSTMPLCTSLVFMECFQEARDLFETYYARTRPQDKSEVQFNMNIEINPFVHEFFRRMTSSSSSTSSIEVEAEMEEDKSILLAPPSLDAVPANSAIPFSHAGLEIYGIGLDGMRARMCLLKLDRREQLSTSSAIMATADWQQYARCGLIWLDSFLLRNGPRGACDLAPLVHRLDCLWLKSRLLVHLAHLAGTPEEADASMLLRLEVLAECEEIATRAKWPFAALVTSFWKCQGGEMSQEEKEENKKSLLERSKGFETEAKSCPFLESLFQFLAAE